MIAVELIKIWCDEKGFKSRACAEWPPYIAEGLPRTEFITITRLDGEGVTIQLLGGVACYRRLYLPAPWQRDWVSSFSNIWDPEFFVKLEELMESLEVGYNERH